MARFIHICASRDDLFALDDEGNVHQLNFKTKAWAKLPPSMSHDEGHVATGDRVTNGADALDDDVRSRTLHLTAA